MRDQWPPKHIQTLLQDALSTHVAINCVRLKGVLTLWRREEADAIFLVLVKRDMRCMVISEALKGIL